MVLDRLPHLSVLDNVGIGKIITKNEREISWFLDFGPKTGMYIKAGHERQMH